MFVFPLIHNDNIYNSANPELKTVNLEPAQATRECLLGFPEPLGSNREKTHVGEEEKEELRVLCSGPPGGKKVRGAARTPAWIYHKETPPSIFPWTLSKSSKTPSEERAPGGDDSR